MNSRVANPRNDGSRQKGYVLIVLLLFVALLSVSFLAIIQKVDFEIKRDREEEMIHRGVQYSRAVGKFINKFHRYPYSIEELESTNNIRFLRKRYKDPITGKDFRILHLNDLPSYIATPNIAVAGANPAQQTRSLSGVGNVQTASAAQDQQAARDALTSISKEQGGDAQATDGSQDQNSEQGKDSQDQASAESGSSSSQTSADANSGVGPGAGGIVVGVASTSKAKTVREFNKKNHYNQWLFVYDPSTNRGGLLTTPSQPPLAVASQVNPQNGAQATQRSGINSDQPPTPTPTAAAPDQQ